jgi:hypothetical protein
LGSFLRSQWTSQSSSEQFTERATFECTIRYALCFTKHISVTEYIVFAIMVSIEGSFSVTEYIADGEPDTVTDRIADCVTVSVSNQITN